MDVELRHLRCLVAVVDEGTFTDAARVLGVSQAAVSRTVAALERELGVRLLRRDARGARPTVAGHRVVGRARRLLADVRGLKEDAIAGCDRLRVGYAWSALGRHTAPVQRHWAQERPGTRLDLVRVNTATAGLADGGCDVAVLRRAPDDPRLAHALVGRERRMCALAADDPLACGGGSAGGGVIMGDLVHRTVLVDRRTGTTTADLWPDGARPDTEDVHDVDDWLTVIATGRCVGLTAEATAHQYPRPGVAYVEVVDAPPVEVHLAWWRDDEHPATGELVRVVRGAYGGGGAVGA